MNPVILYFVYTALLVALAVWCLHGTWRRAVVSVALLALSLLLLSSLDMLGANLRFEAPTGARTADRVSGVTPVIERIEVMEPCR